MPFTPSPLRHAIPALIASIWHHLYFTAFSEFIASLLSSNQSYSNLFVQCQQILPYRQPDLHVANHTRHRLSAGHWSRLVAPQRVGYVRHGTALQESRLGTGCAGNWLVLLVSGDQYAQQIRLQVRGCGRVLGLESIDTWPGSLLGHLDGTLG